MGGELLARTRTRWSNTSSTNWRSKSPTRSKFQSDRFGQQRSGRRTQRVNPQGFHSADSQSYYVVNIILLMGRFVKDFLRLDCWAVDIRLLWPCFSFVTG